MKVGPYISWPKVLWFGGHILIAALFAVPMFRWDTFFMFVGISAVILCAGHSVGVHRLMIHRAFVAPRWLERLLVYLGTLLGMAGPLELVRMHHQRDFLQHQTQCPDFFCHRSGYLKDFLYNFFCGYRLPEGAVPPISNAGFADPFIRFLDRTWQLQQLPLAALLWSVGGWSWVVWGISVRIVVSVAGHWYVGYRCHNDGERPHWDPSASVQGSNHLFLGILSFGEGFHNNHHAFPNSARMGLEPGQVDLGFAFVRLLRFAGLAWRVQERCEPHHRPSPPDVGQRSHARNGSAIDAVRGRRLQH